MSEGRAVAGVDWASETHVACVIDDAGQVVDRFEVAHTSGALRGMVGRLRKAEVAAVAIERGDGPVVETLARVSPLSGGGRQRSR